MVDLLFKKIVMVGIAAKKEKTSAIQGCIYHVLVLKYYIFKVLVLYLSPSQTQKRLCTCT